MTITARRAAWLLALLALLAWGFLFLILVGLGLVRPGARTADGNPTPPAPIKGAAMTATAPERGVAAETITPRPRSTHGSTEAEVTESPAADGGAPAAQGNQRIVTATPVGVAATSQLPAAVDWPATPDLRDRSPLAETTHFKVFAASEDKLLAQQARAWSPRLESILAADSRRLGGRMLSTPVNLVFARRYEARCPARGLAATRDDPPLLMLFVDEQSGPVQIEAVLAHEMAHHLTLDDRFVGDAVLTEGIANWGGGDAVLRWQGLQRWQDAVRAYWRQGRYVSITDQTALQPRPGEDCIARRDRVYNIRTAFVDWLVGQIGIERVLAMPAVSVVWTDAASGERHQQSLPDYESAAGASLGDLERRFLRALGLGGPEAVMLQLRLELQGVDVQ